MSSWLTALVMGLAGSLHCAGMCSPLAMALTKNKPFAVSSILYNSGRVLIYALLGALAAAFGSLFHLAPYQQVLSLLLGVFFLLIGFGVGKVRLPFFGTALNRVTSFLKYLVGFILDRKSKAATFLLGMINGLLPCGLTYMALSFCLILPPTDGFLFMFSFGLGTWPVMIGLTWAIGFSRVTSKISYSTFTTVAFFLVGLLLICRIFWVDANHPIALKSNEPVTMTLCK